jgi:predicted small metal-binding protein
VEPVIRVYASEQTNQRRPGVRLVCSCGWGVVAAHGGEARPVAEVIALALEHASEAHGIDEIRPETGQESAKNRAMTIDARR